MTQCSCFRLCLIPILLILSPAVSFSAAETRSAAPPPAITQPILFNTPEADAIVTNLHILPPDNPWNQNVSAWPLHPQSKEIVASVGATKPLRYDADMTFILVPSGQKRVQVRLTEYGGESDKGPYPVPDNVPIEGWPASFRRDSKHKDLSLDDV